MDAANLFIGMGRAMEILRDDMTIEEAIEILDPINERKFANSEEEKMEILARELKARNVLVKYARENIAKDTDKSNQEQENHEPKPCPFCGIRLEMKKGWYPRDNSDAYVHPSNRCILSNFSTSNGFPTTREAIELWNKRYG